MAKPQNVFLAFWLDDCTCTCLHKHLSRSQWPLDRHGRCNSLPPFYFQLLLRSRKTSTLSIQRYCSPNASFVGPFFSLLALFLVKSSWQALMILIHAQTTLTCVSLPWLRYYHRAQRLAWYCVSDGIVGDVVSVWDAEQFPKDLISVACNFFRMSAVNVQVSKRTIVLR